MSLILRSTKSYHKLPTSHRQHFDQNADGSAGPCSKIHGYDRSVCFEFAGTPDENGWLIGFGDLKKVKSFLEFYFDHTAIIGANDPQLQDFIDADVKRMFDLRVLPYGVSMEMSSLFIWEQVNPYIYTISDGRCWVSKVECREHDSNSAYFTCEDRLFGLRQGKQFARVHDYLRQCSVWPFIAPTDRLRDLNEQFGPDDTWKGSRFGDAC